MNKIENSPVDKHDRPIKDVIIESTPVFVDPFQEVDEKLELERQKTVEESNDQTEKVNNGELSKKELETCKRKIGALINLDKLHKIEKEIKTEVNVKKKKVVKSNFGNFSNW